jgi:hypothetical protein
MLEIVRVMAKLVVPGFCSRQQLIHERSGAVPRQLY